MVLKTIDLNRWYTLKISYCKWSDKHLDAIDFELNNLSDMDTPESAIVPNETGFIMSIDDARELHAWLGQVLVNLRINNL